MKIEVVAMRGEHVVILNATRDDWEVLYRSRDPIRAHRVSQAAEEAMVYGRERAFRGWGLEPQKRGLYEARNRGGHGIVPTLDPTAPDDWAVWQLHPRMSCWDVPVYSAINRNDAVMALAALRRAATVGAL